MMTNSVTNLDSTKQAGEIDKGALYGEFEKGQARKRAYQDKQNKLGLNLAHKALDIADEGGEQMDIKVDSGVKSEDLVTIMKLLKENTQIPRPDTEKHKPLTIPVRNPEDPKQPKSGIGLKDILLVASLMTGTGGIATAITYFVNNKDQVIPAAAIDNDTQFDIEFTDVED